MKNIIRIFFFIFILAVAFTACTNPNVNDSNSKISADVYLEAIEFDDFAIGGIMLGTSGEEVKSKMGVPVTTEVDKMECEDHYICEYWNYKDSWVYIYDGEVRGMSSKSTDICIFDKICPNDNLKKAFEHLGKTKIWPASTDKPPLLNYRSKNDETCWLWVFLKSDKHTITELRLACQP